MIGAQRSFIATNQKAYDWWEGRGRVGYRQSRAGLETDGSERLEKKRPE
jgi:hypothetical protein